MDALNFLEQELQNLKDQGLYREPRTLTGEQQPRSIYDGKSVVNLSSNNYLGLANHPRLIEAAIKATEKLGVGPGAVRTIAEQMDLHREFEHKLAKFKNVEACLLFQSGFTANSGTVSCIMGKEDVIISDELNHASIIDGVRLCKAKRFRYKNNDMADLKAKLEEAKGCRVKIITTDGVFSMDGYIANLSGICDLAEEYGALVMVDDSHAVGFMGEHGKGTHEACGVMGRVDIITGTLGKAMGGASGGYTAASKPIVDLLRQRSRPYLFSNTLAPAICAASIAVIDMLATSTVLRDKVHENTRYFRAQLAKLGFDVPESTHPIVPVMLYDAKVAQDFAGRMLQEGVYVVGFSYPVVPQGKARIRTQVSAGHSKEDLDFAIAAFAKVKADMGI